MAVFLNTTGEPTLGVALCDRCHLKFPLAQLTSDPNYPGLKVCAKDKDQFDPWRLPARQTERINLPFVRPDVPLQDTQVPVFDLLRKRLVTQDDQWLVTEDGQPIEVEGEV